MTDTSDKCSKLVSFRNIDGEMVYSVNHPYLLRIKKYREIKSLKEKSMSVYLMTKTIMYCRFKGQLMFYETNTNLHHKFNIFQ